MKADGQNSFQAADTALFQRSAPVHSRAVCGGHAFGGQEYYYYYYYYYYY